MLIDEFVVFMNKMVMGCVDIEGLKFIWDMW